MSIILHKRTNNGHKFIKESSHLAPNITNDSKTAIRLFAKMRCRRTRL